MNKKEEKGRKSAKDEKTTKSGAATPPEQRPSYYYNAMNGGNTASQRPSYYNNGAGPAADPLDKKHSGTLMEEEKDKKKKSKKEEVEKSENNGRFVPPVGRKMTRKEKKIAKKSAKFDEMDLRNYPMTVGKWIGTFIILALPLINVIACICWFFGVGNRSRTALVRAQVIRFLIVILLIGILVLVGWLTLKKSAENAGAETTGEVMYYAVDKLATLLEGVIGPDYANMLRQMAAEKFGVQGPPTDDGSGNGDGNGGEISGGQENEGESEWEGEGEFQAA